MPVYWKRTLSALLVWTCLTLPVGAHSLGQPDRRTNYPNGMSVQEFLRGDKPNQVQIVAVVNSDGTLRLLVLVYETHPIPRVAELHAEHLAKDFREKPFVAFRLDSNGRGIFSPPPLACQWGVDGHFSRRD